MITTGDIVTVAQSGGGAMGTITNSLNFCLRALAWAAAALAALFVLGFVVPVLIRAAWVYRRRPKD